MKIHYPKINEPAEGFEMVTVKEMTVGTWYSLELENGEVEEVYIDDIRIPRLQGNPKIDDGS